MPRYASIWFPYLLAEYAARKRPELRQVPLALVSSQRGRTVIDAVNEAALGKGIRTGMVLADCKALFPELQTQKTKPGKAKAILNALAEWCLGYTPLASVDSPDGLILDTSGCPHLWGGEALYLENIQRKLNAYGYTVHIGMADTVGAAWAISRFTDRNAIINPRMQREALRVLPPAALRLEPEVLSKLKKLGLKRIGDFADMPQTALRRRFGPALPFRMAQAFGQEPEPIAPVKPVEAYHERLASMEPIATATGIAIALRKLLEMLCERFESEGIGLRSAIFYAYRTDGAVRQIEIGTGHASKNSKHLFRLFEHKIATLEPGPGFEVFVLEATKVSPVEHEQSAIWGTSGHTDKKVAELLDRVVAKTGPDAVVRYLPAEHYWPERSAKKAVPLWEKPATCWPCERPRPVHLLFEPEPVEVTALLPDYPPIIFRHKGRVYNVTRSDGPERIEQEWWLESGLFRDYYCVEDEQGARYWLFRSGPYEAEQPKWFLHGFFA